MPLEGIKTRSRDRMQQAQDWQKEGRCQGYRRSPQGRSLRPTLCRSLEAHSQWLHQAPRRGQETVS